MITGGAEGIGRALAEELAKERPQAIVLLDRQTAKAQEFATELMAQPGNRALEVTTYEVDVRNFEDVDHAVKKTKDKYGRLDYMFNNAGVIIAADIEELGVDDFNYVLDVNLRGVVHGVFAAYPIMKEQGFGHIVNTASMAGLVPLGEGWAAYGTSKYGIVGLSNNLRVEAARHGVRVSALCPGFIRTPMYDGGGEFGRVSSKYPHEEFEKIMKKYHPMDANVFAKKALKMVAKNRPIIIVPRRLYKFMWFVNRLWPSFGLYLARKESDKAVKQYQGAVEMKAEATETAA